jgi:negative regulator of genetic competence, sporulation and motility
MGLPNKTSNRNKAEITKKWLNSKKLEDKLEYKSNTALAKREIRRRQRLSWRQICYKFRTRNLQGPTQIVKILKQISKDIKETARIQGNIEENVFLQYYEKLWNTTNICELQLEHNSADYLHAFITFDELEKVLKLTKYVKSPGQDNIKSELYSMHQKSLN